MAVFNFGMRDTETERAREREGRKETADRLENGKKWGGGGGGGGGGQRFKPTEGFKTSSIRNLA